MITYFPGPAKVYPQVRQYLTDAYDAGVLSISHRSDAFVDISRRTIALLKEKLAVPADYTVLYVSSATESWEIIPQSLVRAQSLHLYSGAFGERGFQYAHYLHEGALPYVLAVDEAPDPAALPVDAHTELIALAQNETSNGTQVRPEVIAQLRRAFPEPLLAVDATSSMAGIALPFAEADVWYASVQKCFGLPAGLGVLICSPRAVARAQALHEQRHYNSLLKLLAQIEKYQTNYTPNVLGIYLLGRVLAQMPPVAELDVHIKARAAQLYATVEALPYAQPLVRNAAVRSDTVVAVEADSALIADVKAQAKAAGMLLGSGYGTWKTTTFRIANFPALTDDEINRVQAFLRQYVPVAQTS